MPRGRYQQKQWEARQDAILAALHTLAAERGFSTVTMDDLADAVGISKATLYQHFPGKDAMLVHLIAQQEDALIDWLGQTAGQPPIARLGQTMRYLMESHLSPLRGMVSLGREDVLPVFRTHPDLMARHEHIIAMLTDIIRQGQQDGAIAADLAPVAIIGAMLALSNVSMGSVEPPECTRHVRATPDHIDQMVLLFERSLRPAQATRR